MTNPSKHASLTPEALYTLQLELKEWQTPPTIETTEDYIRAVLVNELVPAHLQVIAEAPAWHWRWTHGSMGLVSEQGEILAALACSSLYTFDRVNFIEELGDRCWYHALHAKALCQTTHDAAALWDKWLLAYSSPSDHFSESLVNAMVIADSKCMDLNKRLMNYTKKPTVADLSAASQASFHATLGYTKMIESTTAVVLQTNTNKLWARKADAVAKKLEMGDMNRNLANERMIMEKTIKG